MTAAQADNGDAFVSLPPSLAARGFALRPESDEDIPFLRRLYASTRAAELELTNWGDAQKLAFTDSQFDFQRRHYRTYYPATKWGVLEDNGVPMGRLYLERRATTLLIIDIALLPEWRRRGLGTALLEWVGAQAHAAGKSVTVAVEKNNRAQTLYRRLGFREIGDHGVHWDMEWDAAADQSTIVS
jgi:ribosomal protein S18 acetylase RimI-like enzyme